jgi:hypothetical protein
MKGHLMLSPAAISRAGFLAAAGPLAAKEYEFWRGDAISTMLGWGFDTMAHYQTISSGVVMMTCAILFSLAPPTPARRSLASITGTSITENNKGSPPVEPVTAGVVS